MKKFTSGTCKVPPLGSEEQRAQLYNFQIWKMDLKELHVDYKLNMSQGCNVTLRKPKASLGCRVGNSTKEGGEGGDDPVLLSTAGSRRCVVFPPDNTPG